MAFIGIEGGVRYLSAARLIPLSSHDVYYLYPIKALTVALLLIYFRKQYTELSFSDLKRPADTILSCITGIVVYVLWVRMDWTFSGSATPPGFNPTLLPEQGIQVAMTFFRVFGAVLVVPIMEELFWRSFLIRYMIDNRFEAVAIGTFTLSSFLISSLLFGLEHHYILAGIMAGAAYNLLLYRTRSIAHCICAHAVTNLALAIHTITTRSWNFW